jgi:hypothetical protein
MSEYNENEKNELRTTILSSLEKEFYSTTQSDELNNIKDYSNMSCNVNLYKLVTENLLIHKKLNSLEKEITELKQNINELKQNTK